MRIFLKIILWTSAIVLASTSNQIYTSQQKKIDFNSNILISNAIEEKEIKTVIATGYGTSIESASQNAAENALTNVVGSFLDAETILKEKTTISDGILSETTIIQENINDYSQGSIKYFEILNVQEKDSIYIVTARVDVRIDDFRAYIKKVALQTKEISTTNLFAEMGTKKENLDNKVELLKKIITPIHSGEVIDIEIGDLYTLDSFINSEDCLINLDRSFCDPNSSKFHQYLNVENSVFFPFSLKLNSDFYTNAINTLNNISDLKTNSITSISGKDAFKNIGYDNNSDYRFDFSRDVGVILRSHENQTNSQYFILKDIGPRTSPSNKLSKISRKYTLNDTQNGSKLRISLVGKNGQTLYAFDEDCAVGAYFDGELKNVIILSKAFDSGYIGEINYCASQLYSVYPYGSSVKFDITSQKNYGFAFEVDDLGLLKDFKEIKIEYLNK